MSVTVGPTPRWIVPTSGASRIASETPPAYATVSAVTVVRVIRIRREPSAIEWATTVVTSSRGTSGHSLIAQPMAPSGANPRRSTTPNRS